MIELAQALPFLGALLGGKSGDVNVQSTQETIQSQQSAITFNPIISVSSPESQFYPAYESSMPQSTTPTQTATDTIAQSKPTSIPISMVPSSGAEGSGLSDILTPALSALAIPAASYTNATTPGIESGVLDGISETEINPVYIMIALGLVLVYLMSKKKGRG